LSQASLILASSSPRRRELLASLGLTFSILPADLDETILPGEEPGPMTLRLAQAKATLLASQQPAAYVIGADSTVALGQAALGKPHHAATAAAMLRSLRGSTHQVITSVSVTRAGVYQASEMVSTTVLMREYDEAEIAAYIAGGDPFDKAGAYAIQHQGFHPVASIEGCYSNVMGLPLCVVYSALLAVGFSPDRCALRLCSSYANTCPRASLLLQGSNCG